MRPIDITKHPIYPYIENIINKFKKNNQIETTPSDAVVSNNNAEVREKRLLCSKG